MGSTRSAVLWSGSSRLAHEWTLVRGPSLSAALVREFIRPALRAVPSSLARRLAPCRISLAAEVASGAASRWTMADDGLEVSVTTAGIEEHDVAMELLLCLGQGLWERLADGELRAPATPMVPSFMIPILEKGRRRCKVGGGPGGVDGSRFRSMRSTDGWRPCSPPEQTCPERQEREHLGVKSLRCHPRDMVFLGGVPPACVRHSRKIRPPSSCLLDIQISWNYNELRLP